MAGHVGHAIHVTSNPTDDHSMHGDADAHGGHSAAVHDAMGMQMSFYSSNMVTVLFNGWTTSSAGQMLGACVGVFLFALLFEGLRAFREHLYTKSRTDSNSSLISGANRHWLSAIWAPNHLIQTLLYGLQITAGYLLMLIFMTYNVYICVAVVLGATVGFLVFGWKKCFMLDMTADHCG